MWNSYVYIDWEKNKFWFEYFSLLSAPNICTFPFIYMNITYSSCATVNGQSLCLVRYSDNYGQYPASFSVCGG